MEPKGNAAKYHARLRVERRAPATPCSLLIQSCSFALFLERPLAAFSFSAVKFLHNTPCMRKWRYGEQSIKSARNRPTARCRGYQKTVLGARHNRDARSAREPRRRSN